MSMFDLFILFGWIVFDSLYSCSQVLKVFGLILSLKDRSHRTRAKVKAKETPFFFDAFRLCESKFCK